MAGRLAKPDAAPAERFVAPARPADGATRDLDQCIRIAENEARRRGFEGGAAEGRAEARRESEASLGEMATTISGLATLRAQIVRAAELDILELAFRLAEAVVREKVARDEGVATRALAAALAEIPGAQSFTVRCNSEDEASITAALIGVDETHVLRIDPRLRRGGCVVESAAGEVDLRIETQLRVLEHELLSRS